VSPSSPPADPAAPRPGVDRTLLLLTLLAFAVRALYLLLEPRCDLTGDEASWIALGIHELGRPHRGLSPLRNTFVFYPPVYPYFIAVLYRAFGTLAAVQWAQASAGALLVPAVGAAGTLAFSRRAGRLAAVFTVFYPDLVWFSVHFWSETLFLVFLWWAIERTLRADAVRSAWVAGGAGVLLGLATLTRELAMYLAPLAALWLLRPRGGKWRPPAGAGSRAALLLLGLVLTVAPWTIRNALVFHTFIPVSTMGGLNLWQGNTTVSHLQIYEALAKMGGPLEQDRYCRRMAWETIRERQPLWILEKLGEQMPEFWKAGSEVLDHLVGRGACGPLPDRTLVGLEVVLVGPYLVALFLFLLALVRVPMTAGGGLLLVLLAAYNLAHVVAYATTRFRLPVMPVLLIFVAALLVGSREGGLRPLRGWRRGLFVGLLLVALALLAPGLPELTIWRLLVGG
jgi:Dolichyl-phosphate-mannose-protein mannosyltransferase